MSMIPPGSNPSGANVPDPERTIQGPRVGVEGQQIVSPRPSGPPPVAGQAPLPPLVPMPFAGGEIQEIGINEVPRGFRIAGQPQGEMPGIQGLQAQIKSVPAALQEARKAAQDIEVSLSAAATMLDSSIRSTRQVATGIKTDLAEASMSRRAGAGLAVVGAGLAAAPVIAGAPETASGGPTALQPPDPWQTASPGVRRLPEEGGRGRAALHDMAWMFGGEEIARAEGVGAIEGGPRTVEGLRGGVARVLQRRLQKWGPALSQRFPDQRVIDEQVRAARKTVLAQAAAPGTQETLDEALADDRAGGPQQLNLPLMSRRGISTPGFAPSAATSLRQKFAGVTLGRVGEGLTMAGQTGSLSKGLEAMIPSEAVRYGLGMTVAAPFLAHDALRRYAAERAQGAEFQSALGGSWQAGVGQTFLQRAFGVRSLFGGMGEADANQLFQGVTALGQQGGQRQAALDFGTQMYQRLGVPVSESLQVIQQAADNGVTSFSQLSGILTQVSSDAEKAGLSADTMRKNFISLYQQASQVNPTGAATAAGIASSVQTSMGLPGSRLNLGGALSSSAALNRQAAALGVSPDVYAQERRTNPAIQGTAIQRSMNQYAGLFAPQALSALQQYVRQHQLGAQNPPTDQNFRDMETLLGQGSPTGAAPDQEAAAVLSANQMTPGTYPAATLAYMIATQGWQHAAAATARAQTTQKVGRNYWGASTSFGSSVRGTGATYGGTSSMLTGINLSTGMGTRIGSEGNELQVLESEGTRGSQFGGYQGGQEGDLARAVQEAKRQGVEIPPQIKALLTAGNYDPSRRYLVNTKTGRRAVTLGEALSSGVADQIATGTAAVVAGKGTGQTVAAVTGIPEDFTAAAQGFGAGQRSATGLGMAFKDLTGGEKAAAAKAVGSASGGRGGPGGTILVTVDPQYAALFQIITSGSGLSSLNPSAVGRANNAPPVAPPNTGPSVPTG